jgi:acyl dehydratase
MKMLYFEDFAVGQQFDSDEFTIDKDYAIDFARQYDPQYFHTDERAAAKGIWGRLVVSGWQTAAITMKLKATTPLVNVTGGLIGLGIESIKWPRPVYPDDTLQALITVTETRPSKSKPDYGVVKYKVETFNQDDDLVMEMHTAVWVPRKKSP